LPCNLIDTSSGGAEMVTPLLGRFGASAEYRKMPMPHRSLRPWKDVVRVFLREPAFRSLLAAACVVLVVGTVFYHYVEGWNWVDSVYFCTITLTTIGYGDFAPTTEAARLFTIAYVLVGIGIIATFITAMASARLFAADDPASASRRNVMEAMAMNQTQARRRRRGRGRWVRRRSRVRRVRT
jgi:hypothetical protein